MATATEPRRRAVVIGIASTTALGAVAGAVDAVCFDRLFAVYPANQSGNAILFGIALGHASWSQAWRPAVAMVGFVLGVALAVLLRAAAPSSRRAQILLGIEAVLLVAVALDVGQVTEVPGLLTGWHAAWLLLVTSIAMGVQTDVIRQHAGVSISTTYETGALTNVAEHAVAAATGRPSKGPRHAIAIIILGFVLAGYIGGAAVGARLALTWGWVFVVPIAAIGVLLVTAPWWMPEDSPADERTG
jgi:uncharacterized membrane protein YoaK (UPF0700 family)